MKWLNRESLLPTPSHFVEIFAKLVSRIVPEKARVLFSIGVMRRGVDPAISKKWETIPYSFDINWYRSDTSKGLSPEEKEIGGSK